MRDDGVPLEVGQLSTRVPLDTLLPGDAIELWAEGNHIVATVFRCRELVDERPVQWCWLFLDDGSLVEISLDGHFRYTEHRTLNQGSGQYEEIVAQDGALVRFEERVREGTSGRRPVHVTIDDHTYRITSTGTVLAERLGPEPEPVSWRTFSLKPEENVYFGLVDEDDEDNVILGLWTAHVCLSMGQSFDPADVTQIFRAGKG
jgi:hypothetical protein